MYLFVNLSNDWKPFSIMSNVIFWGVSSLLVTYLCWAHIHIQGPTSYHDTVLACAIDVSRCSLPCFLESSPEHFMGIYTTTHSDYSESGRINIPKEYIFRGKSVSRHICQVRAFRKTAVLIPPFDIYFSLFSLFLAAIKVYKRHEIWFDWDLVLQNLPCTLTTPLVETKSQCWLSFNLRC